MVDSPDNCGFESDGTSLEAREGFTALVREGQNQSTIVQRRGTGMESTGDKQRLLALANLLISAMNNR